MSALNLIPLPGRLGLLAAAVVGAGVAGWTARGWKEDASRLVAEREVAGTYAAVSTAWAGAVQDITQQREAERQQAARDRREWQRRLHDATNHSNAPLVVCGTGLDPAGSGPAGGGRLAPGFIGLWNDALALGLPDAFRPWRTDGAGAESDPAGIEPEAALENLAANSEQCNEMRGKLIAWQAWARSIGAGK